MNNSVFKPKPPLSLRIMAYLAIGLPPLVILVLIIGLSMLEGTGYGGYILSGFLGLALSGVVIISVFLIPLGIFLLKGKKFAWSGFYVFFNLLLLGFALVCLYVDVMWLLVFLIAAPILLICKYLYEKDSTRKVSLLVWFLVVSALLISQFLAPVAIAMILLTCIYILQKNRFYFEKQSDLVNE